MRDNWQIFIESDGGDPLMPHGFGGHWLFHISSFIDNSRYLYVPGSLALQEALNCVSKFAGAVALWLASGSNSKINRNIPGDIFGSHSRCSRISTQVKSSTQLFWKTRSRRKSANQFSFGKISSFALKQICREVEQLQSFPMLTIAAALVPPFTNQ